MVTGVLERRALGRRRRRWRAASGIFAIVAVGLLAEAGAGVAGLGGAQAPARGRGRLAGTTRVASGTIPGVFAATADTSARDLWAVGHTSVGSGQTLIAHWNGAGWATVPSPHPGSFAYLEGVAATATTNAWAVGLTSASPIGSTSPSQQALILHWDGMAWTQVAAPATGSLANLRAVAAISAADAWAVGSYTRSAGSHTLILHWNGSSWTQMPGPSGELAGVAASSPSNAWAVGATPQFHTLILHWNGRVWSRVPSPSRTPEGLADFLNSVAIGPGNTAWAVGTISCGCGPGTTLIERWNGRSWRVVPGPASGGSPDLASVISISARNAWAAGAVGSGDGPEQTAILHWNGRSWRRVASPNPDPSDSLAGLSLVSRDNIWAVGVGSDRRRTWFRTVVLHWNGVVWR